MKVLLLVTVLLAFDAAYGAEIAYTGVTPIIPKLTTDGKLKGFRFMAKGTGSNSGTLEVKVLQAAASTGLQGAAWVATATTASNATTTSTIESVTYECGTPAYGKYVDSTKTLTGAASGTVTASGTAVTYKAIATTTLITLTFVDATTALTTFFSTTASWCTIDVQLKDAYATALWVPTALIDTKSAGSVVIKGATGPSATQRTQCLTNDAEKGDAATPTTNLSNKQCYVKHVNPTAVNITPSLFEGGSFEVTLNKGSTVLAGTTGQFAAGSYASCVGTVPTVANCYGGQNGLMVKITASDELFINGSTGVCKATGNPAIVLPIYFKCVSAKACNVTFTSAVTELTEIKCPFFQVKSYGTSTVLVEGPNAYLAENVLDSVAGTAVTATNMNGYVRYASPATPYTKLNTDINKAITDLTASVTALDTKVTGLNVNFSETIVPFFFLGVFGSVFALTM